MTTFNLIESIEQSGNLKRYYLAGLVSADVIARYNAYKHYLVQFDLRKNKSEAVKCTAISLKCSERRIWSTIKQMQVITE